MGVPTQVVAAPYTAWLAPVGTAFPAIDAAEGDFAEDWFKLGGAGAKDYGDDGVTATSEQTIVEFRGADSTGVRKVWRSEENLLIALMLHDTSPEQYAKVLNDAVVTTVAADVGTAGEQSFPLLQGREVAVYALYARGRSPLDSSLAAHYKVPIVYQAANPAPQWQKGGPAGLACEFRAIADDTDGFGDFSGQSAAATG